MLTPDARLAPGPGLAAHRLLGARLERRQHAAAHRGAARGRRGRPLPLRRRPGSTRRRCRSGSSSPSPGRTAHACRRACSSPPASTLRRYPVIIYHYGGPGSQVVDNDWGGRSVWHKLMAQRGFAVFSVDNQSSIFFGKAGEDRDYRRFGPVNLAGQLAGGRLPEEPPLGGRLPPRPLGLVGRRRQHPLLRPQPPRGLEGRRRRRAGDRLEALRLDLDRALPRPPAGQRRTATATPPPSPTPPTSRTIC